MNLLPYFLIWSQTQTAPPRTSLQRTVEWLWAFSEPGLTINQFGPIVAGLITWVKVVGLFSLLAWVLSWVISAYKTRVKAKADVLDIAGLLAVLGAVTSIALNVLQAAGRIKIPTIQGVPISIWLVLGCFLVILAWLERALWVAMIRLGKTSDLLVTIGIHLALVLGFFVSWVHFADVPDGTGYRIVAAVRMSATFMGYVVLVNVFFMLVPELIALRARRLLAIAQLTMVESTRKMWAPWVVIVIFGVILAFTHWFLPPQQRPAEMGRLYVGAISLLCMLLLTVMVTVLAPLSLPQDIQAQTIYTVVSKPVRRLELIWGRMIGYMTIVTGLVLVFGLISLTYLSRIIGGEITTLEKAADKVRQTDPDQAKYLEEQAEQLRTRMSARVPVKGSLSFVDSMGKPNRVGIDVGQELEYRSHIEGGTPSSAIWQFGPNLDDPDRVNAKLYDRRVPVESLLKAGTIEAIEDRAIILEYGVLALQEQQKSQGLSASDEARILSEITRAKTEIDQLRADSKKLETQFKDLIAKASKADQEKNSSEADQLRREAAALHSPPIPMEMTFTIYRTTKGRVGEPVYAAIEVENPRTHLKFRDTFPIHEYYTNKRVLPSSYLVGSLGYLRVTIQCMSPTQYLGMAESDFYLLAYSGNFGENFMKGLFGIWLQAMVLTAIGVFAGTFLSWPVALLFTIAFFVAGHAATALLRDFFLQAMLGGGPFESLLRLISHENQVSDLAPTLAVVVAKTFDAIVMPVMTRMAYLIPNLGALDVSNTVSDGFAVGWPLMISNILIAGAYALPFSIAGYFILKNREVAA
jgi:hypothetical protein